MDLLEAIKTRKSIRAFRPDPVSREDIEEMLKLVVRAPSAINLQPWEFYIVMGEEKARLSRRLVKLYREKQISCSPGNVKPLSAEFNKRGAESFILMNPYLEKMGMDFNCFEAVTFTAPRQPSSCASTMHSPRRASSISA
jgi:nitroreductase